MSLQLFIVLLHLSHLLKFAKSSRSSCPSKHFVINAIVSPFYKAINLSSLLLFKTWSILISKHFSLPSISSFWTHRSASAIAVSFRSSNGTRSKHCTQPQFVCFFPVVSRVLNKADVIFTVGRVLRPHVIQWDNIRLQRSSSQNTFQE